MGMHRAGTLGLLMLAAAGLTGCCAIWCPPKTPRVPPKSGVVLIDGTRPGGGPGRQPGLVEVHRTQFAPHIALSSMTQIGYRYTKFDTADTATEYWLLTSGIDVPVEVGPPTSMSPGQVVVLRAIDDDPLVHDGASLCAKYGGTYTALFTVTIPAQTATDPCGGP